MVFTIGGKYHRENQPVPRRTAKKTRRLDDAMHARDAGDGSRCMQMRTMPPASALTTRTHGFQLQPPWMAGCGGGWQCRHAHDGWPHDAGGGVFCAMASCDAHGMPQDMRGKSGCSLPSCRQCPRFVRVFHGFARRSDCIRGAGMI